MRILLVDNYDSFTFNLYQLLAQIAGAEPVVAANDRLSVEEVEALRPDAVVLSPGPGRPQRRRDFGVCGALLRGARRPTLGVCLGHQGLVHVHGGRIVPAPRPMHGRASEILHTGEGLFAGIPQRFTAVRYHSLVAAPELPAVLEPLAWTADGLVMAVRHRERPLWGVQFHPESIATRHGRRLLANFLRLAAAAGTAAVPGVSGTASRARGTADGRLPPPPPPAAPARQRSVSSEAGAAAGTSGGGGAAEPFTVRWRRLDLGADPEAAFLDLFAGARYGFWLDSSRAEPGQARFSFIGAADGPRAEVVTYRLGAGGEGELRVERAGRVERRPENVFDYLQRQLRRRRCRSPELPFDFNGGFVGYLGYELKALCGAAPARPSTLPDALFLFADRLLAFDHRERAVYLVHAVPAGEEDVTGPESWLDTVEARLRALPPVPPPRLGPPGAAVPFRLDRGRGTYLEDVARCRREIRRGETYEVCLTDQARTGPAADPLAVYRVLRRRNPAPHAAYLALGSLRVLCSSPERFLAVDREGSVTARPIKGTMRRDADPAADAELRRRLAASEKDRSENLMIVDLLRNDLGKVCRVGSVAVPSLMRVESYATVHQLVSTVRGRLRPDRDAVDCVVAAFPPGSMTGAPKLRTMEILERLEGRPREIYSGALGFFGLGGGAELNVVIRTAVATPEGISIGAGGAVVDLSDPEAELAEMLLKAAPVIEAVAVAARGRADAWRWELAADETGVAGGDEREAGAEEATAGLGGSAATAAPPEPAAAAAVG